MRDKLLGLLNENDFVSGNYIAKQLDVSRTAVWKQVKILKNLGYEIESVKKKGYRLISRPDIPIPEEIKFELDTDIIGSEVYYFKSVTSTNLVSKKLIEDDVEEGTIVVADIQKSGRGRKNRSWYSPKEGLWFSVILYPNIPPQRGMMLTMIASVSVVQAIKNLTGIDALIKWPNDVLIKDKKVCGILTELNAEMDRINYSIVGIGINVNNKLSKYLSNRATTLLKELGSKVSRVQLLRFILKRFDENYHRSIDGDYSFIHNLWISMSKIIGRKVRVKEDDEPLEGIVTDVDEEGCIILQTNKKFKRIVSGDLEYL